MNTFRLSHILLALTALIVVGSFGCDDGGGPPVLPPERDMEVMPDIGLGAVQISSPSDGTTLTAADDLDGDLSNGLQIRVTVVTTNPTATVSLSVPGAEPVSADAVSGRVEFDASLAADRNENYRIIATTSDADGNTAEDAVTVQVRTGNCTVQVFPQPRGAGCDLGADADDDPNVPGLQTTLRAETNCDEVTFTVNNLPSQPVAVENGEASLAVTLRDGENTITVSVTDGIVDPVIVGPYPLTVSTSGPSIELSGLSDTRPNVLLLADGEQQGGQVYWTMTGTARGVAAGQTIAVTTEPALDNAPAQVTVDDNGQFRLELALARGGYYAGVVTLSGTDTCGVEGSSAGYAVQLDGVIPEVRITSPVDGQLLIFAQDTDPLRAGAQIPVTVEVTDPRPANVDYSITVECAAVGGAPTFIDRARQGGDAINRSDLLDADPANDSIIVTFQQSEAGEFICRAALAEGSNPVVAAETVWRAFFERPNLGVLSPERAPACVSTDNVELIGAGASLDGNQPNLSVIVTPEGGEAGAAIALDPLGGQRYGYTFTPQTLPDGQYTMAVSGTVVGQVPVEVNPEELSVIIDRTAPSLDFVSPAADGVFTDAEPATPGTQAQITLSACGVGGQMLTINSVPALPGFPQMVEVPAGQECSQISFPPVIVPLGPVVLDASVVDHCGLLSEANIVGSIPAENTEARITAPESGTNVNIDLDTDSVRQGCQIQLEAIGQGLGEGAEFNVCTNVAQGPANPACEGRSSVLDGACRITGATPSGSLIACPVTLQEGSHQLSFVGVFGGRVESAPVNLVVDCQVPSVTSVSVVQDEDSNGCVHGQERANPDDPAGSASVTVRVETVGIEDGEAVRVHNESGLALANGIVTNNVATIGVELLEGNRRVYASGSDAAGNELPAEGNGFIETSIRIDTIAPTPAFVNVNDAACLNAAADEDGNAADLQYAVQVSTGRGAGEQVTARMLVDGVVNGLAIDEADNLVFPTVTMGQGAHELTVTVADDCGNVGSVSGFELANGRPDWSRPSSTSIIVDTFAPGLELQGIVDGTVLEAGDDIDGDSSNGFQVDLAANLVPFSALSAGSVIQVDVNGVPASTSPSPLAVPENVVGALPVRVTLSPGPQNIGLSATDSCGNAGESAVVSAQLNIAGCTSRITSFESNPAILGSGDAVVNGNSLVLDISGTVDLLDAGCAGANIQLIVDGNPVAGSNVDVDGNVTFAAVQLPEGDRNLRFRVGPVGGNTIESPNQAVSVDLSTPAVAIVQPVADSTVLTDSNGQLDGQQAVVQVDITEATVVTARTATLEVDGVQVGGQVNVGQGSPVTVTFADVTFAAGARVLRVCVADAATNSDCAQWSINADAAAPSALADLVATVVNTRSTEVNLNFTAPGDDGDGGGNVAGYEIRRSANSFVDETDWDNASATSLIVDPDVAPGDAAQIVISGAGGPSVGDGLPLNEFHYVAVRAVDDAGRTGGLAEVEVDLRMTQRVIDFVPTVAPWTDSAAFNATSVVIGLGDVDGDALDDVLVTRAQGVNETVASVVFGTLDVNNAETVNLDRTVDTGAAYFGAGGGAIGDVNGDGAPDFAVLGFTDGFGAGTASIYFGCTNQCDRNTLATPDVQITAGPGRYFGVVTAAGNFNQRAADGANYGDIFLGGSISAGSQHQTSYVIAGRDVWPAEIDVSDDPGAVPAGVTILRIPDAKSGQAAASVGDLDADGRSDLAFSAGNPNILYLFDGGDDLPAIIDYDVANPDTRALSDPCSDPDGFGAQIVGGVDLDGDPAGLPDFAVGDGINRRVSVFDQTAANIDCFGRSRSLFGARFDLAGDIDGDGAQDIIVSHGDDNRDAFIFLNDGQGRFGIGESASPRGYHVLIDESDVEYQGVAGVGDFNGDGRDDFAVAVKQPGAGNLQVIIYY